jgi:hypothetical protein
MGVLGYFMPALMLIVSTASNAEQDAGAAVAALKPQYSAELQRRAERLSIEPHADDHLLEHTRQVLEPRLVPIGGSVHAAVGYDYSVYAFIEAGEGVIAIDTGWFMPHTTHGVIDVYPGVADEAGFSMKLDRATLEALSTGVLDLARARSENRIQVEGDERLYGRFTELFSG